MNQYPEYDETMEYQRPLSQQAAYKDKTGILEYKTTLIKKKCGNSFYELHNRIGYLLTIKAPNGVERQFHFADAGEFRSFMAKRNIMIDINSAYAMLQPEFSWTYGPEFAADFGIYEPNSQEILTSLPIGRKELHGNI